ncbi:MAG: hypothetical protein GQ540_12675 [Lutibacter sp.]|uniref:hypothetical protein n=1 Tax=Lutibacter sp. TaxID=1925666 RepID=UPI0019F8F7F0|nr:hypothetical protein [Lutibacter sp.]NOR29371.1 hypothetical protein [Lutibacter sp.]
MIIQSKRLIIIVLISVIILLLPLIAMQLTDEVNWTLFDFMIAGVLLVGTGIILEFIMRKIKGKRNRIIMIVGILLMLFLIWAELAVGIFGLPFSGN